VELIAHAKNPVPSGAVVAAFQGYDKGLMRYARWDPTRGPERGTVCCFPGRSEFIEKYFEVVADLRRRGFAVAIMDWRGQGGSCRPLANRRKCYVSDFSEYDRDLACFMQRVVLPDCPPPYYALAHSMGGHLLVRASASEAPWFKRIVVTAPMLAFHHSKVGTSHRIARIYAGIGTMAGCGSFYVRGASDDPADPIVFEGNPLTSDRDRFARNRALIDAAPKLLLGGATIGWLDAAYRSMRLLADPGYPARVKVPLLVFIAGADTIVSPSAIERFAAGLKLGTQVYLPTAKHEILQETDDIRGKFWSAFDAYLGIETVAGDGTR
jgi:lysophospholipase